MENVEPGSRRYVRRSRLQNSFVKTRSEARPRNNRTITPVVTPNVQIVSSNTQSASLQNNAVAVTSTPRRTANEKTVEEVFTLRDGLMFLMTAVLVSSLAYAFTFHTEWFQWPFQSYPPVEEKIYEPTPSFYESLWQSVMDKLVNVMDIVAEKSGASTPPPPPPPEPTFYENSLESVLEMMNHLGITYFNNPPPEDPPTFYEELIDPVVHLAARVGRVV
ncbi:uncharacterized protein [Clytia hemisphaerica]|uniref:Uncharacterized protein n=1 Tax=Clytia hemisphaerica TaxID=252671 RepID=A0A7M5WI87_9CNID